MWTKSRTKTGIKDFILSLDKYPHWYNEPRIKASFGYKNPVQYRQSLDIMN
ncbi:IS3 family transposase [uncultured Succinatimonas sp.]|uniref:IS3 family transposase n=1 Tax=uncultured Succinatimonas sp. TaxID=1262973 RepID=UPI00345B0D69